MFRLLPGRRAAVLAALAALAASLAATAVPAGSARTSPNPVTCEGYAQPRVFLESQSWWSDDGVMPGAHSRHTHSAACFPLRRTLTGKVTFDIRTVIHHDPGSRLEFVRVQAHNGGTGGYGVKTLASVNPKTACNSGECTFWTRLTVDTSVLPKNGWTEFRLHSETKSADTSRNRASNGWMAYVKNGKPAHDTNSLHIGIEGRGWYRDAAKNEFGYENARFLSSFPSRPISGVWKPRIRTVKGSGGETVTRSFVAIDPNFHAHPEDAGWVRVDRAGTFDGYLSIDTTKLANGKHKLVIRADAAEPNSTHLSGVQVIPFVVDNSRSHPAVSEGPSVAVTRPSAGQVVSGWIGLDVDVSDPDGVSRVVYYVDGKRVAYDDSPTDFGEPWDSRKVANGQHSIVARAFDSRGNASDSLRIGFKTEN